MAGDADLRKALHVLVGRLAAAPRTARPEIVRRLLPLLADGRLSPGARVSAAARLLQYIPDRRIAVLRVVRALTVGLSPLRSVERLRQVQQQIEQCRSLDAIIEARDRRVVLTCPRCRVRLARIEMIKHLWDQHALLFTHGKIRALEREVARLRRLYEEAGEPEPLDQAIALAGAAGLRRWMAKDELPAEEIAPLLRDAADHDAGLCPQCCSRLPAAVPLLPPPLDLASGRLAGDGFAVEVRDNRWVQTLSITVPSRKLPAGRWSPTARGDGTLAAAIVLLVTLALAPTETFASAAFVLAAAAYVFVRSRQTPPDSWQDRVVDAAWSRLAPDHVADPAAARFLTRLCRTSLGRGEPVVRAGLLGRLVERASEACAESQDELQLLATAAVLQVEDMAAYGRDVAAGIAALAAEGFVGARPADYAEYVVAAHLSREHEPGELARLRILLLAGAFEAGLSPADLLTVWAGAPKLRRVMAMDPPHRLGLLAGVWRSRESAPWRSIADAETVFELARTSPPTASRVLASFPDLLLFHRPDPPVEALVGPVLVCSRGLAVGGHLTADPDATVALRSGGRELVFGRHRIEVAGKLPSSFAELVRHWLHFRTEVLVPFIEGYLTHPPGDASARVLPYFCRKCLTCGAVSAVTAGALGREVEVRK